MPATLIGQGKVVLLSQQGIQACLFRLLVRRISTGRLILPNKGARLGHLVCLESSEALRTFGVPAN
jgi:hypothetical protein